MPRLPTPKELSELPLDADARKAVDAYKALLQEHHKDRQQGRQHVLSLLPLITNGVVALSGIGAILAICFKFGATKPEFAQAIAGMIITFVGGFAAGKAEKSFVKRVRRVGTPVESTDEVVDLADEPDEEE